MCACAYRIYACLCRDQKLVPIIFLYYYQPFILRQDLLTESGARWLGGMAWEQALGIYSFLLSQHWHHRYLSSHLALMWVPRIWTRSSCLPRKHFKWVTSPACHLDKHWTSLSRFPNMLILKLLGWGRKLILGLGKGSKLCPCGNWQMPLSFSWSCFGRMYHGPCPHPVCFSSQQHWHVFVQLGQWDLIAC